MALLIGSFVKVFVVCLLIDVIRRLKGRHMVLNVTNSASISILLVRNRPSGRFMVDMEISSNIMKSFSPKCEMTFWDIAIYIDTLNWSDSTPICKLITELYPYYRFWSHYQIPGGFHRLLQQMRQAIRGRLLLRTTGPVPLGLAFVLVLIPFSPELVMFSDFFSILLLYDYCQKSRGVCETLQYVPGGNKVEKAVFSFNVKVKATMSLTVVSLERAS